MQEEERGDMLTAHDIYAPTLEYLEDLCVDDVDDLELVGRVGI